MLLAATLMPAMAAGAAETGLSVQGAWMRAIMPSIPAAGYFTLTNDTGQPLSLVGASSPDCGMLMLHRSVQQNGQDKMVMVKSVAVPPHGSVNFAPGGYHLMCMSPSKNVARGHAIPITLMLDDKTTVTATFPVRGATGK